MRPGWPVSSADGQQLMVEAMAEHIATLRQAGKPVPEPADADSVMILDPAPV